MGCLVPLLRRILMGWVIAKALAWFRRRQSRDIQ